MDFGLDFGGIFAQKWIFAKLAKICFCVVDFDVKNVVSVRNAKNVG